MRRMNTDCNICVHMTEVETTPLPYKKHVNFKKEKHTTQDRPQPNNSKTKRNPKKYINKNQHIELRTFVFWSSFLFCAI